MPVVVSVDERGACFGARASRYRKYKLSEETDLVVRCELDGVMNYKGQDQLLSIKALNEFDPKVTGAQHELFLHCPQIHQLRGASGCCSTLRLCQTSPLSDLPTWSLLLR